MKTKRLHLLIVALAFCGIIAQAQMLNPVKWTKSIKMTDDKNGVITFTANIDNGWHLYSNDTPDGGPIPLSIKWDKKDGVKLVGGLKHSKAPTTIDDEMFGMKVRQWEGSVSLSQRFTTTDSKYKIEGEVNYQACSDQGCLPGSELFDFSGTVDSKEDAKDEKSDEEAVEEILEEPSDEGVAADSLSATLATSSMNTNSDLWAPVKFNDKDAEGTEGNSNSLWFLFWTCFLGGFIALLTPCVWPIIPLTVSFFLKKG
ncbi:MAG: thiol:disulfide interchange protein, partial [Muribaculaceae bacterium]|nr:thiol:disulfide interchange protein [Muribaculaceae bacterium]